MGKWGEGGKGSPPLDDKGGQFFVVRETVVCAAWCVREAEIGGYLGETVVSLGKGHGTSCYWAKGEKEGLDAQEKKGKEKTCSRFF